MQDIYDVIKNIEGIYESDTAFQVLKDFERVLDELDLYVYKNWEDGEIVDGPRIDRHWVTCTFMWPRNKMPDPMGGKRLADYDCKIGYKKDYIVVPRKIRKEDDIRPGTKKGKLDREAVWTVEVQMPKKLIADIYSGYSDMKEFQASPAVSDNAPEATTQAPDLAPPPPVPAPGGEPEAGGGVI
jgi:hypothetical protein